MEDINELAQSVHVANAKWWQDLQTGQPLQRNKGELLMLVITELGEAVEGIRKNLMDDKLPHRLMEEVEMADAKIRLLDFAAGFSYKIATCGPEVDYKTTRANKADAILSICKQVGNIDSAICCEGRRKQGLELSRAIYMIENYCRQHGLDLAGAITEKMAYNAVRVDHTHEARMAANRKRF